MLLRRVGIYQQVHVALLRRRPTSTVPIFLLGSRKVPTVSVTSCRSKYDEKLLFETLTARSIAYSKVV
jgi:hypothetical protein